MKKIGILVHPGWLKLYAEEIKKYIEDLYLEERVSFLPNCKRIIEESLDLFTALLEECDSDKTHFIASGGIEFSFASLENFIYKDLNEDYSIEIFGENLNQCCEYVFSRLNNASLVNNCSIHFIEDNEDMNLLRYLYKDNMPYGFITKDSVKIKK